jgi:hypothetical protein
MRILALMTLIGALAAAVPFERLAFADGVARDASDVAGQAVVLVYFCSH